MQHRAELIAPQFEVRELRHARERALRIAFRPAPERDAERGTSRVLFLKAKRRVHRRGRIMHRPRLEDAVGQILAMIRTGLVLREEGQRRRRILQTERVKKFAHQIRPPTLLRQRPHPFVSPRRIEFQPAREQWIFRKVAVGFRKLPRRLHRRADGVAIELLSERVDVVSSPEVIAHMHRREDGVGHAGIGRKRRRGARAIAALRLAGFLPVLRRRGWNGGIERLIFRHGHHGRRTMSREIARCATREKRERKSRGEPLGVREHGDVGELRSVNLALAWKASLLSARRGFRLIRRVVCARMSNRPCLHPRSFICTSTASSSGRTRSRRSTIC